jgi:triacylglycerol lipase
VIRGTVFGIELDRLEDMNVQTTQDFTVGSNTVQVASGTATGHGLIINAQGANGNTLLQELQSLVGAGNGATIFVTGHSLGGALSTTVALYLQDKLPGAVFQVYTFAGPSAGLTDFAALFDSTFPASSTEPNCSWHVYNAWDVVPQAWERDTLQAILNWYPSPGPVPSPLVHERIKKIVNSPGDLPYTQPSVNPCGLNEQDWGSAYKYPPSDGFLTEISFQHDSNTYLHLLGAPTVAMVGSLSLNKMLPGTSNTVDLTGLGFTSGAQASFSGDGVTAGNVNVTSQSKLTMDVTVTQQATPGPRDVVITQAGGTIAGGTSAFFVNQP